VAASLYLGLISGTSADGIDAALVRFEPRLEVVGARTTPYSDAIRESILTLATANAAIALDDFGALDVAIGHAFADAALAVLRDAGIDHSAVAAIGSHGQTIRHRPGDAARVTLKFAPDGVKESVDERAIERRTQVAHGVLTRSLYEAGAQAGMSDTMIWKLANAFGYDIDFAQDLREGDTFSVIYDDVYREGEHIHDGDIIAATFINQGKRYTAVRYTNADGEMAYYSEDGRPLRKAFLRTPVEFTRISSVFSVGRMHPILGYMRAHKGVDYAAPTGTPIRAAGDGKITFRGWSAGYGNFVTIQHNGHISTAYGHMSAFANEKLGQHVSQGQIIGYVGMTGLATGPHLHYEFRIDGQHRDPLTVTLPKEEPLPQTQLALFRQKSGALLAKLKFVDGLQLARAND
jgi:murein DD-endopeptidase MepM/ murein hydrolase activator NlpD